MNKQEEIKKILASMEVLLASVNENDLGSPVQSADLSKEKMADLINDHTSMLRGCMACLKSVANDFYSHADSSKHLPEMNGYDHVDYACKQLGYGKMEAARRFAYANKNKKVILG